MANVAIITARGGSKRIPRKNIKEFCGKPILVYSVEAAVQSRLFDEVMVSTDDDEIAEVARKYGAEVPFYRSAETSNDYATTADVLKEVLEEYQRRGRSFEWMCCIYPTAPFVTAEKLKTSFAHFQKSKADGLIPVVRFSYPPQRCFVIEEGALAYKWPEYIRSRSQDLEPYYHDAGQYYFWNAEKFMADQIKKTVPYLLDESEVQDIDNVEDWKLAEIKYRLMKGECLV